MQTYQNADTLTITSKDLSYASLRVLVAQAAVGLGRAAEGTTLESLAEHDLLCMQNWTSMQLRPVAWSSVGFSLCCVPAVHAGACCGR